MDCSRGLCGLLGDMRRDRLSRLYAATDRTAHGAPVAILISSLFFTALHLTKGWATPGMVPIVFGAGVLLGLLAWSSGIAHSRHDRPRRDAHWAVRLLVDRNRRRLHRAAHHRDGRGSAFPHRLRRVPDLA